MLLALGDGELIDTGDDAEHEYCQTRRVAEEG